ncbi:MAG: hypothetical protein JST00_18195 [Deltaproteobacteria bacterium]|nr:hypothetical protein [Deltaproteobacteria bacterium]
MGPVRKGVFAAVLALGVLLASPRVDALTCQPRTVEQQVDAAKVIFIGRVASRVDMGSAHLATFLVSRPLKGVKAGESSKVWFEPSKYQWPFAVGEEYVVFAVDHAGATEDQRKASPLWTFECMGDLKTTQAEDVVRARVAEVSAALTRKGTPPPPASASASASAPASASASASAPASASASASASAPASPPPPPAPRGCGGCSSASSSSSALPLLSVLGLSALALRRVRRVSRRQHMDRSGSTGRPPGGVR